MALNRVAFVLPLLLATALGRSADPASDSGRYFGIQVVDDQTGRGVPMVELKTTSSVLHYTDSAGWVAFYEPGLMNRKVWFGITSHGYEFARDGFGSAGVTLETRPGATTQVKIKRLNIAERLYRITGQGIYRDTVLLGLKAPIVQPLLNAEVTGQDGVLNALYRGKLYWFYGDTCKASYALGNFSMSGATTALPDQLDPSTGFDLTYFTNADGAMRAMAPMQGEGVVWLYGVVVIPDQNGRERMFAYYQRRRGLGAVLENGFVAYNDEKEQFEKLKTVALNPPMFPQVFPFTVTNNAGKFIYFTAPYPALRVKADSYLDLSAYEGFTCLKARTRFGNTNTAELDRGADGKLVWAWKPGTPPLTPTEQQELVATGKMKREESPLRLQDAESGKPILLNNCSCFFNQYRKRYVMIASEFKGATMLGEVWYSEAEAPEGPWVHARKIITHANKPADAHDFYNPTQHSFFDREGGRVIYLEGCYVNTFSGNPHPTPYYEYNQIMYRLDLADPRLKLAEPPGPQHPRSSSGP